MYLCWSPVGGADLKTRKMIEHVKETKNMEKEEYSEQIYTTHLLFVLNEFYESAMWLLGHICCCSLYY